MAHQLTTVEELERRQRLAMVQTAIAKQKAKQPLSAKELAAWKRWEAEQDLERGNRFVSAVPKKIYCEWSGRQTKILHDQARLYGIPLDRPTIELPAVIAWLHEFLATHKHELAALVKANDMGDGTLKGKLISEQIRILQKRNDMLEQDLAKRNDSLLPREDVRELLNRLATILRSAGERLYKRCGDDAGRIMTEALDNFARIVRELDSVDGG